MEIALYIYIYEIVLIIANYKRNIMEQTYHTMQDNNL
jgi:hypothetical protein